MGGLPIGGDAPIAVQSMLNTDSHNADACFAQAKALEEAGCAVVRIAVPDREAARIFPALKERGIRVPLVADIHFDWRIALESVAAGADKIRINPGNIGEAERVREVVRACEAKRIPVRIGVNSGSLQPEILKKYGAPTAEALAESALDHVRLVESFGFSDLVLSIKASAVQEMIGANRILAARCDYPIHLGVTEAGSRHFGTIKNAVGIGSLLCDGIGDTIRVSLTADPVEEVREGYAILHAIGLSAAGVDVISCPTCGRTRIPLIDMVEAFESRIGEIRTGRRVRVALMGCAVNGPGEAREADIGIAGGDGYVVLFCKGEIVRRIPADEAVDTLIEIINRGDF